MATKQRKARGTPPEESPAEKKKRRSSSADDEEKAASSSQSQEKSNKKRGKQQTESPVDVDELFHEPEEEEEEEERRDDQEEDDFDGESTPKKSKAKKQRQKKDSTPTSPSKVRPAAPKQKSKRREEPNLEDALFERVKLPNAATVAIVNDWIKSYRQDQPNLTRDLINFVLHAAGSPGAVSASSFEEGDIAEVIDELAQDAKYKEEGGDYPLVSRAKALKKFRANYADFWNKLILACARSWLFDDYVIGQLDAWLAQISASSCRPFRHAATVAAMEIVTALSAIAAALTKERNVAAAQLAIEKKKKNETAAQIQAQLDKTEEKIENVHKMIDSFFESIFVHRYRDTGADIRVASVTALSRWMTVHPEQFLTDNYLKYLAWTLFDRVPEVRHAALRGLQDLYGECVRATETDEERDRKKLFADRLAALTERYRSRLVEMAYDKDATVASTGIDVCNRLAQLSVLEPGDISKVLVLVTDDSAALREAVSKFVAAHLQRTGGGSSRKGKTDGVRELLAFVEQSAVPEQPNYVVDALWSTDYAPLRDWTAMAELLAEQGSQALSPAEQTALVKVLTCSVKKAMGVAVVPKDKPERPDKATTREENQKKLATALMKPLPELLNAFQAEAPIVAELLQLIPFFSLESFRGARQLSQLKELLRLLRELFFLHTNADVHAAVGQAFRALLSTESSIYSDVDVAFHDLTQQLHDKLEGALATALKGGNDAEEDGEGHHFSLSLALQRLYQVLLSIKVPQAEFGESLQRVLEARSSKQLQKHKSASAIVNNAVKAQALLLQWEVAGLGEEPASDRRKLQHVLDRRDKLIDHLKKILSSSTSSEQRTEAYFTLLDTLVVFSPAMRGTTAEALVYDADGDVNTHVQEHFKAIMAQTPASADDEDELLDLKERAMAALARGLLFNTLNEAAAAQVVMQLTRNEKPLLDLARSFIVQWRERKSGRKDYDLFFEAIRQAFEAGEEGGEEGDAQANVKLLCTRVSLSFGVAAARSLRDSLLRLIRALILYGLQQPEHMRILQEVTVLVRRLASADDAAYMLKIMVEAARKSGIEADEDNRAHRPLVELHTLLDRRARGIKGKDEVADAPEEPLVATKKKTPARKRNKLELEPVRYDDEEAAEKTPTKEKERVEESPKKKTKKVDDEEEEKEKSAEKNKKKEKNKTEKDKPKKRGKKEQPEDDGEEKAEEPAESEKEKKKRKKKGEK